MPEVEHVVVLMLENRSYDHLLGLLGDSRFDGVKVGSRKFSNTYRPTNGRRKRVTVTADGAPTLAIDPPHSHRSARIQLGLNASAIPTMKGFLEAYARKVSTVGDGGTSDPPDIRWRRIVGAAVPLLVGTSAPLAAPRGWPLVTGAVALEAIALATVAKVKHELQNLLPPAKWLHFFVYPPMVIAGLAAGSWLLTPRLRFPLRAAAVAGALALGGAVVYLVTKKRHAPPKIASGLPERIMACMDPKRIPVLAELARSFTVCTRWFCSVPGATWPNRNFAHSGSSEGTVDICPGLYESDTIFERIESSGRSWHIYRDADSLAQVIVYRRLWDDSRKKSWRVFTDFADDVANHRLPAYSFIEPCHEGIGSNSQHPGNNDYDAGVPKDASTDFGRAEQLVADVYETLRCSDYFANTILLITYDEHGGFYDHVPPPTNAVPPCRQSDGDGKPLTVRIFELFVQQPPTDFAFNVLGPRVPAIVIGGRVPSGVSKVIYDHTSIPRTLRNLFAPDSPRLSDREAAASTFDHLASLSTQRTDVPNLSGSTSAAAASAFGPLAEVPVPKPRDDQFMADLWRVAKQADDEIKQRSTDFAPLEEADDSNVAMARRFTAFTRS